MNKWTSFCNGLKLLQRFIVFTYIESLMPESIIWFLWYVLHFIHWRWNCILLLLRFSISL